MNVEWDFFVLLAVAVVVVVVIIRGWQRLLRALESRPDARGRTDGSPPG